MCSFYFKTMKGTNILSHQHSNIFEINLLQEVNDMVAMERPDWQAVMSYITSIYKHFELDMKS